MSTWGNPQGGWPKGGVRVNRMRNSCVMRCGALFASADIFQKSEEYEMTKVLSMLVAAMFAVVSVNAFAAKHMAAEKGAKAEKKMEKKAAKKKMDKKMEKKDK